MGYKRPFNLPQCHYCLTMKENLLFVVLACWNCLVKTNSYLFMNVYIRIITTRILELELNLSQSDITIQNTPLIHVYQHHFVNEVNDLFLEKPTSCAKPSNNILGKHLRKALCNHKRTIYNACCQQADLIQKNFFCPGHQFNAILSVVFLQY